MSAGVEQRGAVSWLLTHACAHHATPPPPSALARRSLTLASGARHTARYAVVTVPLGVLKKAGALTFAPPLPPANQAGIAALGMGLYEKVVLVFDRAWWSPTTAAQFLERISGAADGAWAETMNLQPVLGERVGCGLGSWFKLTNQPRSHARSLPDPAAASSPAPAPASAGQPILVAFNAAEYATKLEAKSDAQAVGEIMALLRKMFGSAVPAAPRDSFVTRWGGDPFSYGSFSYAKAPMVGWAPFVASHIK